MPRTCRLYQIDAFTRRRFAGNPAGVVADAAGLTDAQMQAIARELNNSETAFILPPIAPDHDVHLRFFTPTTEVPVCGHATVAAHYVRALEGAATQGSIRQLTGAGVMRIDIEPRNGGDFRIWMQQRDPEFGPALTAAEQARLVDALGIDGRDLGDGPIEVASTGHSKVMVPLRRRAVLDALAPDFAALARLSRDIGCNGFHAFVLDAPDPGIVAHARMFAPAIGIAEDPVTGNANGPLGAYLVRHRLVALPRDAAAFTATMRQGEAMGRPGEVGVEVAIDADDRSPKSVRICGDAVVAFRAELSV